MRNRLAQIMPVVLQAGREVRVHGDYRSLAFRVFRASVEAPPHRAAPTAVLPEPSSVFSAVAETEGFFGPELMGLRPDRRPGPARWHECASRPAPGSWGWRCWRRDPSLLRSRFGWAMCGRRSWWARKALQVALPVPGERASSQMVELEIRSSVFVPGRGDERQLGVAVSRIWFMPQ